MSSSAGLSLLLDAAQTAQAAQTANDGARNAVLSPTAHDPGRRAQLVDGSRDVGCELAPGHRVVDALDDAGRSPKPLPAGNAGVW